MINFFFESFSNLWKPRQRVIAQWDIKIHSLFFNLVCSCFYLISFGLFSLVLTTSGLEIDLKEYLKIDWFLLGLYGLDVIIVLIMLKKIIRYFENKIEQVAFKYIFMPEEYKRELNKVEQFLFVFSQPFIKLAKFYNVQMKKSFFCFLEYEKCLRLKKEQNLIEKFFLKFYFNKARTHILDFFPRIIFYLTFLIEAVSKNGVFYHLIYLLPLIIVAEKVIQVLNYLYENLEKNKKNAMLYAIWYTIYKPEEYKLLLEFFSGYVNYIDYLKSQPYVKKKVIKNLEDNIKVLQETWVIFNQKKGHSYFGYKVVWSSMTSIEMKYTRRCHELASVLIFRPIYKSCIFINHCNSPLGYPKNSAITMYYNSKDNLFLPDYISEDLVCKSMEKYNEKTLYYMGLKISQKDDVMCFSHDFEIPLLSYIYYSHFGTNKVYFSSFGSYRKEPTALRNGSDIIHRIIYYPFYKNYCESTDEDLIRFCNKVDTSLQAKYGAYTPFPIE